MIITDGNDWIEIKDYLPYGAFIAIQEGRVSQALPSLIVSWSENVPINEYYCSKLRSELVYKILQTAYDRIRDFQRHDHEMVFRIFKNLMRGHKYPDDEYVQELQNKYYNILMVATDHKGNLIQLPYPGGLYDQPFDFIIMANIFKSAFVSYLAEENEKYAKKGGSRSFRK